MMYYGWNNMMDGFGAFGFLPMILFWILLICVVIAIARHHGKHGHYQDSKTPIDILKERYAKGEIDKKEFEEKKKDLI